MATAKKKAKAKKDTTAPKVSGDVVSDLVKAIVDENGPESAQVLGSNANAAKIRGVITTQCSALDEALGRGGVPLGRITIIHGPEGCGKTTLCLHLVAAVQAMGGICVYLDKEYKLDPDYAQAIGVNTKRLIISQPKHLEATYGVLQKTIEMVTARRIATKKRVPVLIVLDSINACITKEQLEGSFEDKHYAPQAGVHSRCLPKVLDGLNQEDVALVFIAQNRTQIGKMFGDPNDISGGHAPKYYASVIINIKRIGANDSKTAQRCLAEVRKNQIAPPFKKAEFWIRHGVGIDQLSDLIERAEKLGVIGRAKSKKPKMDKNGKEIPSSWYEYPVGSGKRFANGSDGVRDTLIEDDELRMDIMSDVSKKTSEAKAAKKVTRGA